MSTLAVGAVFRRETRYLREWIEFHLLMGVEKFYLYSHAMPEDPPWYREAADAVLRPYVEQGIVVNNHFDEIIDFQMKANKAIVEDAKRDDFTWVAILDLDEFLFSPKSQPLPKLLLEHTRPDVYGIAVWWRCYGSSGLTYPPMLQTEAFTQRAKDDDKANHTHKFIFRPDKAPFAGHGGPTDLRIVDENFKTVVKGKRPGSAEIFRINHYAVRSHQDWAMRKQRGLPPGGFRIDPKDLPTFYDDRWTLFEKNDVKDKILHRHLPQLKQRLGIEHYAD